MQVIYALLAAPGMLINIPTTTCGYHTALTVSTFIAYVAIINDNTQTVAGCVNGSTAAGSVQATTECNVLYHELVEALAYGWKSETGGPSGNELADICAFIYGTTGTTPGGQTYNWLLNGTYYLLQEIYLNTPPGSTYGGCAQTFTPSTPVTFFIGI
jgi:hypothetical protein